jgi:hypothetical protein
MKEMNRPTMASEFAADAGNLRVHRTVRASMERGAMTKLDFVTHGSRTGLRRAAVALWCGLLLTAVPGTAIAQFFDSGSTGVHGPFPPVPTGGTPSSYSWLIWNVGTGHVWFCNNYTQGTGVDACDDTPLAQANILPAGTVSNGVYHFTDFNVSAPNGQHRWIAVVGTNPNTPLTILSENDITLAGHSAGYQAFLYLQGFPGKTPGSAPNLSVVGGRGGPGGFDGGISGNGGNPPGDGSTGLGPAGGAGGLAGATTAEGTSASPAQATPLNPSLTPLAGGSGGGGGAGFAPAAITGCNASSVGYAGGGGGGGGGAVLLAASNRVTLGVNGAIYAHGGNGGASPAGCGYGSGGAGGSVRIVATEITGTGSVLLSGGVRGNGTAQSPGGFVRLESSFNTYTGSISGSAGGSFISFPTAPLPANQPQLRITAINGTSAPTTPSASLTSPDVVFPSAIQTPVTLDVAASNVPMGTEVKIRVAPAVGSVTMATTNLTEGTPASSTGQATVTLPPGAGVITATATFNVGGGMALNAMPLIDGERPQQVEVVTQADGTSKTFLIARSGARFEVGQAAGGSGLR